MKEFNMGLHDVKRALSQSSPERQVQAVARDVDEFVRRTESASQPPETWRRDAEQLLARSQARLREVRRMGRYVFGG
jgi:hypothetical protein